MTEIKLIETNGKKLLIVEVQECDNIEIAIDFKSSSIQCANWDEDGLPDDTSIQIDLPPGSWQIIGFSTELSEEQMKEICEHCKMGYANYKNIFSSDPSKAFTSSLPESYLSLLAANGVVDRNPYEKPTDNETVQASWIDNPITDENREVWKWQEAQKKVKSYLILIQE